MKKSVICGLVLLLGFSALSAGDVASFVDKGFSEDGKYYVFGQYGKTDKKYQGYAEIYQPKLDTKLSISFDANNLDGFVQWKMMGIRDYVLGMECGNCYADGRDVMRKTGMLKFLKPAEKIAYKVCVSLEN